MTPERWRRVEELYHAALERPQEQRAAFLDEACGDDQELRHEVESLLRYEQAEDSLLDRPQETPAEMGPRLAAGAELGPYRIEACVGAGGMGEVYRATDTRLGRTVAIKLLQARLTDRAGGRQRFQREARAISALSHPHICSLHDIGEHEGTDYLVMEYVEGETLEARLRKGKPPLKTALRYGIEIADAVAAAHAHGIVHRDLKPGNVMITSGGVKLLDFGLAKMLREEPPGAPRAVTESLTETGAVMGTLPYMAPEQIEGKECDARADIFALGLVLYEMLAGRRAFAGDSPTSLAAAILKEDPPAIELRPPAPRLEDLIRACLAKDPAERWQSAADIKRELEWALEEKPVARRAPKWSRLAASAAVALVLALAFWAWMSSRGSEAELRPIRLTLTPPPGAQFSTAEGHAISPDGRQVAFVGVTDGKTKLWLQPLDSSSALELPGTEGALFPFWSPDSRTVGFFVREQLKKIDVAGGLPRVICEGVAARGGAWNTNGDILLAPPNRLAPLMRVPASGGTPVLLAKLETPNDPEASHRWPQFLPDGRRFIYLDRRSNPEASAVCLASLDRPHEAIRLVNSDHNAQYVPERGRWPSCLLWMRGNSLVAQPFDAGRAQFMGEAVPLAEDVLRNRVISWASFTVSTDGTLVYCSQRLAHFQLTWFSREGKMLGPLAQPGVYVGLRISPDGRRVALTRAEGQDSDIWQVEIARGVPTRLTFGGLASAPVWSPDGRRIAYAVLTKRDRVVCQRSATGAGEEERLTDAPGNRVPIDWSPDGRFLLVSSVRLGWRNDELEVVPLDGDRKPVAIFQTPFSNYDARFSPDGRWVAYASNESGRFEVYVRSFPAGDVKSQVSTHGGRDPRWRRDGKELYYRAADGMLTAAPIRWTAKGPEFGAESAILRIGGAAFGSSTLRYDVTPDGQRFLVLEPVETPEPAVLRVVFNWQAGLKR